MKTFTLPSAALAVGVFGGTVEASYRAVQSTSSTWREDLPWAALSSELTEGSLKDTSPSSYVEECLPEFEKPTAERTNWNLIDQPSGVCMSNAFQAFVDCWPESDAVSSEMAPQSLVANAAASSDDLDPPRLKEAMYDVDNPAFNVPSMVLHPRVASDAVAAVKFAAEHGLMISVKNSGHSWTGSSTRSNSLLLNMRQYESYSAEGIMPCDATVSKLTSDEYSDDLSDQPCRLAVARGKPGVIKVGGGENFGEVYISVREYNIANDFPFHAVGGSAATVSPQGWTWQGGLSGNTGGRTFGFGADQVLQIEMVIATGHHIKFGPTEWEEVDGGGAFPKTTKVSGVCNVEGEWKECDDDDDIPFEDFWSDLTQIPFCSGWGVVLSVYLQLHDYLPMEDIGIDNCPGLGFGALLSGSLDPILQAHANTFFFKFALDPTSLDFSEEQGRACSAPGPFLPLYGVSCYSDGIVQAVVEAWAVYMQEVLPPSRYNSTSIEEIKACLTSIQHEDYVSTLSTTPDGNPADSPPPAFSMSLGTVNALIPASWMLKNLDNGGFADLLTTLNVGTYHSFGGVSSVIADDQMNAVSDAHRGAGTMAFSLTADDDFFANIFPLLYDTSDKSNFPGFLGSNHANPLAQGPLKDDWTRACPQEWTAQQRQEKCISVQEAIYGTELLAKLEAIKEAVDPAGMFTCQYCIGDNKQSSTESSDLADDSGGDNSVQDDPPKIDTGDTVVADTAIESTGDESSGGINFLLTMSKWAIVLSSGALWM
ncbi:hypothetical protein THAOC_28624 [Thalassiosira oceanica]|uniref:FAD-binding PCMH-type domain-containing protein n=1 Tax=Thalassiosira oceanica TaxID=159749 RepID=K0REK6_THAOC|nr:hypothetical protein THAOC_28624 [Thalassiosira oceanica]|eukprot:EJK52138.1 hypothetical protein THAOC_28624 [Thalassiosira oceanica]